jgi:hypothetical protein
MNEVEACIIHPVKKVKFGEHEILRTAVGSIVSDGTALQDGQWEPHHVLIASKDKTIPPDQVVGRDPVTAYLTVHNDQGELSTLLRRLETRLTHQEAAMDGMKGFVLDYAKEKLSNISCQVLNAMSPEDCLRQSSSSTRMASLKPEVISKIARRFQQTDQATAQALNEVITKRNNSVHFKNTQSLGEAVQLCLENITKMGVEDEINQTMPVEYWVLKQFKFFKQFFVKRDASSSKSNSASSSQSV